MQMWFTGEYLEVVEDRRLVYTESMSDEHGNAPSGSDTSEAHASTEVRVDLEDVGGRTKMVMTHTGVPSDSPGATGWVMAFDKLSSTSRQSSGDRPAGRHERRLHARSARVARRLGTCESR